MNNVFTPIQQFLITWLLVLVTGWFTLTAISYVGELVSILVTAGLIAFLLNYAVIRLQVFLPRGLAAGLVYLTAGLLLVVIGLTIVPPVFSQARQLGVKFPELLESGRQQLAEFQLWSADRRYEFRLSCRHCQLVSRLNFYPGNFILYAPRRTKSMGWFDKCIFPRHSLRFNRHFAAKSPAICIGTVAIGTIYGDRTNSSFLVAASAIFSVICGIYRVNRNSSVYRCNAGNRGG